MTTPHNPDNLTPEQVGKGWRLPSMDEPPHPESEVYKPWYRCWEPRSCVALKRQYDPMNTYRVPVEKGQQ